MEINGNKYRKNAKLTKINCFRCNEIFISHRNDAKYCSDLCRVQDRLERIEEGYEKLIFKGRKDEMYKFFRNLQKDIVGFSIRKDFERIENVMQNKDDSYNWKEKLTEYRISYFKYSKRFPYEIYATIAKAKNINLVEGIIALKNNGKII